MYKLLLATNDPAVVEAFSAVKWEELGFKQPRVVSTAEEALSSLRVNHADAVAIGLPKEQDDLLVEQPGEQQGLALAIGQHIAHHIAGEGAGKFVVVLRRAAQQAAPQQGEDLFHFHGVSILSAKSGEDIPLLFSIITGRVGRRNGEKGVEGRILGELFDGLVRLSQGIHRIFVPFAEEKILPTPQKHAII